MATISEITNMEPSWELTERLCLKNERVDVRVSTIHKQVFALKQINTKSLSKKERNRLFNECRKHAVSVYIEEFKNEDVEIWDYSNNDFIVCCARKLVLNKVQHIFNQAYIRTKYPFGYMSIKSLKDRNTIDFVSLEEFTIALNRKYISVYERNSKILYDIVLDVIPEKENNSFLWDSQSNDSHTALAKNLQYIPNKVRSKLKDILRKEYEHGKLKDSDKLVPNRPQELYFKMNKYEEPYNGPEVEKLIMIETHNLLNDAFDKLTDVEQGVIKAKHYNTDEELSLSEIARRSGKKRQSIHDSYHSALKKLRKQIEH